LLTGGENYNFFKKGLILIREKNRSTEKIDAESKEKEKAVFRLDFTRSFSEREREDRFPAGACVSKWGDTERTHTHTTVLSKISVGLKTLKTPSHRGGD
jgi:hypothetical protein